MKRSSLGKQGRGRAGLVTRIPRNDHQLDAIVHKSVEHQPTLIQDGVNPPYVTRKGVPALNTFLVYVPSITVPSGFTTDNLPTGITFLGGPFSDAKMINLAYSYEQNTHHRKPPKTTPGLRSNQGVSRTGAFP